MEAMTIVRAPWRVENPLEPIAGESLDGFIARVAAANWVQNSLTITQLAGVSYGHKPSLTTHCWEGLPILADCLQVDIEELEQRSYPTASTWDRRLFYGVSVMRRDIETTKRRFSPGGLAVAPHHRASWQLRAFPFCSETWQYLIDQCPRCGATQRWYHTNGVDRCDQCVEDLSRAPANEVPVEERPALIEALRLLDRDEAVRRGTLDQLPPALAGLDAGDAYELLVRLAMLVQPALAKVRAGNNASWPATPKAVTSATAAAWTLLKGWPNAVLEHIAGRLATAPTRHIDGNQGASMRFLRLVEAERMPGPVIEAIASFRRLVDLDGPEGPHIKANSMGIKELAFAVGEGTKELADLRRKGALTTIFGLKENRPIPLFDRSEIQRIASLVDDRAAPQAVAWRLGISYHGVEQLMAIGLIPTIADRYCVPRYGARQTTAALVNNLEARIAASAQPEMTDNLITLKNASRAVGGKLKPWGPIFEALLDGRIKFGIGPEGQPLSHRIRIDRSDLPTIRSLSFEPEHHPNFIFHPGMSRMDAGEVLNLQARPYTYATRHLPFTDQSEKFLRISDVLDLAQNHIASAEIALRLGISCKAAYALAQNAGVTVLGPAGFSRDEVNGRIFGALASEP